MDSLSWASSAFSYQEQSWLSLNVRVRWSLTQPSTKRESEDLMQNQNEKQ